MQWCPQRGQAVVVVVAAEGDAVTAARAIARLALGGNSGPQSGIRVPVTAAVR